MSPARVLVIIPAHDEEASLGRTIDEVRLPPPAGPDGARSGRSPFLLDVLVVDDGSADGTAAVARAAGIPVVRHPVNLGVGGALQTGFRYAIERGYDAGVQLDADGQHDPSFLPALLEPVLSGGCDVSIGSRFVARSGYRAPAARRFGMVLFSGVVRLALHQRIADTTSGFRAYSRAVMQVCQFDFPRDFPDAPLLIALSRRGFRLHEVPVVMRERQAGQSFYTLGKSLYYPYKNLLASLMAWLQRPA
ncbi:MAG TPA: glycosyltransferase family 2 protein [Candidatus Eisenbacteria bacterium]